MHILFALPGLHRVRRGAEVAFESVGQAIAAKGVHRVTMVGSGAPLPGRAYAFRHLPLVYRDWFERWPRLPFLRGEFMYEDLTFAVALELAGLPSDVDVTVTCSFPYTSWALRHPLPGRGRPPHVYVTQNGDWAASGRGAETRLFGCEGLVCTNPLYLERNRDRWRSTLIPNGVDPARFHPGLAERDRFGIPVDRQVVLMVSALEPGKRVIEAMHAVAAVPDAWLLIAGDGPQRGEVDALAAAILPGRFRRDTFGHDQMPALYRSADLFLHTKIRESFGNVYIEALASGVPIVAHEDEVTRWILRDHATLVDSEDRAALTQAIGGALHGARGDPATAATFAHTQYAWDVVADRYIAFFEAISASGRAL